MKTGLTAGTRKSCVVCGKQFTVWVDGDWAYRKYQGTGKKQKRLYFCTWSCLRAWEKENEQEKARRKKERDYAYDE